MSNTKKSDQEPSIEEILESIRQIISDDDGDAQDDAPKSRPSAAAAMAVADDDEDDILDLTDVIDDDQGIDMVERAPEPVVEPEAEPEPVPAAAPAVAPAPIVAEEPRIEQPPVMDEAPMTTNDPSSLLSAEVADVATAELSKLMTGNLSVERDHVGQPGKVTLEDIAVQLMRPLLKEWLDQNLPAIVEKAVQREVEKLSRRAGG